jgi:hypothetical protein
MSKPNFTLKKMSREENHGTLVSLAWRCDGDEKRMLDAIASGYRLTGTMRGKESQILDDKEGK